jgi:hypothetical protein
MKVHLCSGTLLQFPQYQQSALPTKTGSSNPQDRVAEILKGGGGNIPISSTV